VAKAAGASNAKEIGSYTCFTTAPRSPHEWTRIGAALAVRSAVIALLDAAIPPKRNR
jgi:hypothetical protein